MVAIKPTQSKTFIINPPKKYRAMLIYGTDLGLVNERAKKLSLSLTEQFQQRSEIINISASDIDETPERLLVELQTIPMFAEHKVVRTSLSRRISPALVKQILNIKFLDATLIVEGGSLKPNDAIRKLFEASESAAALPCFPDTQNELSILIDEMLYKEGYIITEDAKQTLQERLGVDRAQSRSEIEKIMLYAANHKEISCEDILTIMGDTCAIALDDVVNFTAQGDVEKASFELLRFLSSGENPHIIVSALQRHFIRLSRLRGSLDSGKSFDEAARLLRPPLFFKQRDKVAKQCRRWTNSHLNAALSHIFHTIKLIRRNPDLENELTERLVLELAAM
ncbi:MAG: hypothetical protein TECD_00087 [Hyphomicrobiaceae bacterium hypho_1]